MGKAINDLVQEHERILHVLEILKEVQVSDKISEEDLLKFYLELADFIEIFADRCHHGKEEHNLYHTLAPLGQVAGQKMIVELMEEHVVARALTKEIKEAAEAGNLAEAINAASKYRTLLLAHIQMENEEMFPTIEKRISLEQEDVIYGHFLNVEKRTLGDGGIARLNGIIRGWEADLLS